MHYSAMLKGLTYCFSRVLQMAAKGSRAWDRGVPHVISIHTVPEVGYTGVNYYWGIKGILEDQPSHGLDGVKCYHSS